MCELTFLTVDGRNIDHATKATVTHAFPDITCHVERGIEVDIDDFLPGFLGHFMEWRIPCDARIVDQNFDRAEFCFDFCDAFCTGIKIANVKLEYGNADFLCAGLRCFVIAGIGRSDLISVFDEAFAD